MKRIIFSNNNPGLGLFLVATFLYHVVSCQGQTPSGNGTNQVATAGYVCVQRGPDSKVWQQALLSTNTDGDLTTNEQSYTELATGICYIKNGEYVDSVEDVDPVAGGAQAVQGRHQVQWALNANTPGGAVTLITPDAKQLTSTVFGLAYYDVASGSNVAIGQLQDCSGAVVAPNQVLYANAFSNVTADVLYMYTKAGLSQDIVLRQAPPAPDGYGLSDNSTILQVYTEFFNPPPPAMSAVTNGNVTDDQILDFGEMKMGVGQAFFLNGQGASVSAGIVSKQWVIVNNRHFLIESIPYSSITNQLQQLPHASNLKPGRGSVRRMAFLESNPSGLRRAKSSTSMKLATAETIQPQLKIDYELLSSSSNLTLQGDTTYFVTGTVNVTGTTTIEGGAVVKYTNYPFAQIATTNIVCLTGPYSPGVFTSMNDNSVGTVISGSTGIPSAFGVAYYLNSLSTVETVLIQNVRFSYAGVAFKANDNETIMFRNCQFLKCGTNVVLGESYQAIFENVLAANCNLMVTGGDDAYVGGINMTVDNCITFTDPLHTYEYGGMTNCIFTEDDDNIPLLFTLKDCNVATSGGGIYQTVGAASYYLANGSTNRGAGTANIDPVLLADLQTLTTYPPTNLSGWITNPYTLSPQVQRNTNAPDLGYHYSPIDYAINIAISNATVTVLPGTMLAGCGTQYGVYLYTNATFYCQGTAISNSSLFRYNAVQEQSTTNWESASWEALMIAPASPDASFGNFAFTDWFGLAGDTLYYSYLDDCPLWLENCQFYNGVISMLGTEFFSTNCLYRRAYLQLNNRSTGSEIATTNGLFNNLFWRGLISSHVHDSPSVWSFEDNLFDQCTNTVSTIATDICSNNAYVTTNYGVLPFGSTNVVLTNSPAYQAGALGVYYYPTNLSLIHGGSRLASAAGLYHYTVTTNNVIEGTNMVSIGFHYVAVDANTNPLDSNGDGLPDYVKDSNGDGLYDSGDLANWLNPFNIYDQGTTLEGWTPPYLRLGYWRFNNTNWMNEAGVGPTTNANLSLSNSFSGNAVSLTSSSSQLVYPVTSTSGGTNYFNPANGTVRFWYQPNWSTTSNAPSTVDLLEASGTSIGFWELGVGKVTDTNGNFVACIMSFVTQSNQYKQEWSFSEQGLNGAIVHFKSNLWYQIVLTYSPTNIALYTNGVLLATGNTPPWVLTNSSGGWSNLYPDYNYGSGNIFSPPASDFASRGFSFGNEWGGSQPAMGQLDELETFNYPLTAQQVAWGFPTFGGASSNMVDTYYTGLSDMLQTNVYGFTNAATTNAIPVRLGYWRFDSPLLYGEEGQMPLSYNNVALANSWSGMALVINPDPASQITYADVGSNGWANVNCRQGSVRFWFRPDVVGGPGHAAPFFYMGTTTSLEEWGLWLNASGTSITFVTASNNSPTTQLTASCNLTNTNWTQIVLTYGSNASTLYLNGVLAANGSGIANWPNLTNRNLGFVIGNNMSHNASINGQFEEMETFNYQLAASDIAANFQLVASVDSDLDGIPDYLEDIHLTTARPFLGAPVVITGTIEAEQFDMGGPGVGYSTTNTALNTVYRPTKMIISSVTNDTGGGYCLDQMHANDWTQYTINVLVPQDYVIETRVAGIINTGGVFRCEFTNSSGFGTNTDSMTIATTNWATLSSVVYLPAGTNVMRLHGLTNAPGGPANVGRFNYISIYPYLPTPTIGTNNQSPTLTSGTNVSYATAANNAVAIQTAVNNLGSGGGTVQIPSGTFMVAQASPNEANDAYANASVNILSSNVKIAGMGRTSTTIIAYNRATTAFAVGANNLGVPSQYSNFTLSDMTIEAQPHRAVSSVTNTVYDAAQLPASVNGLDTGCLAIAYGKDSSHFGYNILFTNCQFLSADRSIVVPSYVSNVMVQACNFIPTGLTDAWGSNNLYTGQSAGYEVAIEVRSGDLNNLVVLENTYDGNILLTNTNTNLPSWIAPDGLVYFQGEGNVFVARNFITNYALEAVQLNGGPNSVVGNTFYTLVSDGSCCALNAFNGGAGAPGVTGTNSINYSTCFIGNSVYGGRTGEEGVQSSLPFTINFCGNSLNLYSPFDSTNDWPGSAVWVQGCEAANVCGNTLVAGSRGFWFQGPNTNAVILNNNFGAASYRGIGYLSAGDSLSTTQIFGNTLSQGVSFHVQLPYTNSFGWFINNNKYVDTNSIQIPLFTDPASSAAHIVN